MNSSYTKESYINKKIMPLLGEWMRKEATEFFLSIRSLSRQLFPSWEKELKIHQHITVQVTTWTSYVFERRKRTWKRKGRRQNFFIKYYSLRYFFICRSHSQDNRTYLTNGGKGGKNEEDYPRNNSLHSRISFTTLSHFSVAWKRLRPQRTERMSLSG